MVIRKYVCNRCLSPLVCVGLQLSARCCTKTVTIGDNGTSQLLSANATVTKCKMDWNTVSTARTIRNFPLYCKTLLHSEAFTELHVYSCKRMYIASALFYCNSNRISHMSRCVSQFSVLDDGQILIIHKKQEIKQIFSNTTIIY